MLCKVEVYWKFISKTMRIDRNVHDRTKFSLREGSTVSGIRKFIAKVRETGFIFEAPGRERCVVQYIHLKILKL